MSTSQPVVSKPLRKYMSFIQPAKPATALYGCARGMSYVDEDHDPEEEPDSNDCWISDCAVRRRAYSIDSSQAMSNQFHLSDKYPCRPSPDFKETPT